MSEDSKYEFNVPFSTNLDDSIEDGTEYFFARSPRKRMRQSPTRTPKTPKEKPSLISSDDEQGKNNINTSLSVNKENDCSLSNKSSSQKVQKLEHFESSNRQSPRLASIAKALLPNLKAAAKPPNGQGHKRAHRRSLSDGSIVGPLISKVTKNGRKPNRRVVAGSGLTDGDKQTLGSISSFSQSLAFNRQRSMRNLNSTKCGPTKPKEFTFQTDKRLGMKTSQDKDRETGMEFARTLRSCSNTNNEVPRGPTKVIPFNLHQSHKVGEKDSSHVPFMSMAELNVKFHTKTPERFRTSKRNAVGHTSNKPLELTIPQTPALTTRSRARETVHYPNQEEINQLEYDEALQHQFKAKPFNPKVFQQPKEQNFERKKMSTVIEEFDITDSKRPNVKQSIGGQISAALRSLAGSTTSLYGVPHRGVPCNHEPKRTALKPFSFDRRNQAMMEKKKEKIEKIIEEEHDLSNFRAGPMPIHDDVYGVPAKKPPTPTKPKPFNLRIDQRGVLKQKTFKTKLEEEENDLAAKRRFHAQADSVLYREPFIPAKSLKPLTDISSFSLNTEQRNEERMAYQYHLKEKEDELQRAKRELAERKRREEDAEVARLRKEVVHKPQPIPNYKPVIIKQGLLPVTIPISPVFSTRTRSTARHNNSTFTQ